MQKYKICPICKTKNPPALFECANCETDLTGIRVIDETAVAQDSGIAVPQSTLVRVCDCGASNSAAVRKCADCGEDISDVRPTVAAAVSRYRLTALDGDFCAEIAKGEYIVGRDGDMSEYLCNKPYVSRIHARLTNTAAGLELTNLSGTNFTFVNNEMLAKDESRALSDGDEIGLGGKVKNGKRQGGAAYFSVKAEACI